ncbi:MAPEG family protein [Thalassococcus sp. S3]|uniref:MAPEG family protein n=1 Tax=Thalassococcus sp. S3 TaxID=2017482 RepID=UPI00102D1CFA|nr:MAPEG family protein [Thalassococcus sp. S3]
MISWLLAGLAIYYFTLFLPGLFLLPQMGFAAYTGSRDAEPEPSVHRARALRIQRNSLENIAPFLALGILALVVPEADMDQALLGAQVYVLARVAFLALYIFAVPFVRSLAWIVGFIGLIAMAFALI